MIKKSDMIKSKTHHSKCICEECGKKNRVRHMALFHGKLLCNNCRITTLPTLSLRSASTKGKPSITLEQALSRTYLPNIYDTKRGSISCSLNIPHVLAGKKLKLVLADEK